MVNPTDSVPTSPRDSRHQAQRRHVGEDALRFPEKQAARVGERNALRMPPEQHGAKRGLQRADLQAERWLLNAKTGRGTGHVPGLGNGNEVGRMSICQTYQE